MKKVSRILARIIDVSVRVIFAGIAVYLWLLAANSTTVMLGVQQPLLIGDDPWINVSAAVIILVLGMFFSKLKWVQNLSKKIEQNKKFCLNIRIFLLTILAIMGMIFVFSAHQKPQADQKAILDVAAHWREGDWHDFSTGNYAETYPHQLGIITLIYIGSWVVGPGNAIFWQLLNVAAIGLIAWTMAKISDSTDNKRFIGTLIIVFLIAWLPLTMYSTFVYGTLWGLAFLLLSVSQMLLDDKQKSGKSIVYTIVFAYLAIMCKSNCVIGVIGMVIYLWWRALATNNWRDRRWLVSLVLIAVMICQQPITNIIVQKITGQKVSRGMSSLAYVAMGLHDSGPIYKGWWDNYTSWSYEEMQYSREGQADLSRSDIRGRSEELARSPMLAAQFFADKNASGWNNPDFGAILINQGDKSATPMVWTRLISNNGNAYRLVQYLNLYQFIILSGVLIWVIHRGRVNKNEWWYMIVVIGGLIFHSVWEIKSQYTLPYFALLIPLSVSGWWRGWQMMMVRRGRRQLAIAVGILILMLAVIQTGYMNLTNVLFRLNHDEGELEAMLAR